MGNASVVKGPHKSKIAILDHDMTLVNTIIYFYRAYNQARIAFRHEPITFKEFLIGYMNESLRNPPNTNRLDFWLYFSGLFKTFKDEPVTPMPGAYSLLNFLKDYGFDIFVLSGRRVEKNVIIDELSKAGIDDYIADVYTLRDVELSRPFEKTRIMSQILERAHSRSCIAIGDYSEDINSAREHNCYAFGVAPFGKNVNILYNAGAIYVDRDLRGVKLHLEKTLDSLFTVMR